VTLAIVIRDGTLVITLADDGRGFDPGGVSDAAGQDGVANMRQRMLDVGGTFELTSASGSGTRIELRLAIDPAKRNGFAHAELATPAAEPSGNGRVHADHGLDR
jgi:signal transduction histidine kinase